MARKPDTPCAGCGKLLYGGSTSKPAGERMCRQCRADGPPASAVAPGRTEQLEAIRQKLATELAATYGKDAAPIAKALLDVMREIHGAKPSAEPRQEASRRDELAKRREERRRAAGL